VVANACTSREWRTTRLRILRRDRRTCGYCGAVATTVDHRLPRSRGGTDDDANLVACCEPCQYADRSIGASRTVRTGRTAFSRAGRAVSLAAPPEHQAAFQTPPPLPITGDYRRNPAKAAHDAPQATRTAG
jgi:hypothetical protein